MPSRVSIYCRRSVAHVGAASIRAAIDAADLYTLAEAVFPEGGEEEAVDAMRERLRIDDNLAIHWKPRDGRPIQIHLVDGDEARAHLAEELEGLDDADGDGARRVLSHLRDTHLIVSLEMGLDALETLDSVLAEVVAYHFAEEGDGLVWFYHRAWAAPDDWGTTIWATEG